MEDKKKYVIAMDSFKECMTSSEANEAVCLGLPDEAEAYTVEVSDGGEGFLTAMHPERIISCNVHDALMRPIEAEYGITGDTAIIEVARVVGLQQIEPEQRNPLKATSYGLGEMLMHAWKQSGCTEFIIGLGGTATSDCGLGMLKAMKTALFREQHLPEFAPFDHSVLGQLHVTLATDVTAPLLGPQGAAYVFAPQKGASEDDVIALERRAKTFADAASRKSKDMRDVPGAGAAGGLGYAFLQFMDAHCVPGANVVLEQARFSELIKGADMVITGEGHADSQTLMGKLPAVVLQYAKKEGIPTVLLSGKVDNRDSMLADGFKNVIDINEGQSSDVNPLNKEVAKERIAKAIASLTY